MVCLCALGFIIDLALASLLFFKASLFSLYIILWIPLKVPLQSLIWGSLTTC